MSRRYRYRAKLNLNFRTVFPARYTKRPPPLPPPLATPARILVSICRACLEYGGSAAVHRRTRDRRAFRGVSFRSIREFVVVFVVVVGTIPSSVSLYGIFANRRRNDRSELKRIPIAAGARESVDGGAWSVRSREGGGEGGWLCNVARRRIAVKVIDRASRARMGLYEMIFVLFGKIFETTYGS